MAPADVPPLIGGKQNRAAGERNRPARPVFAAADRRRIPGTRFHPDDASGNRNRVASLLELGNLVAGADSGGVVAAGRRNVAADDRNGVSVTAVSAADSSAILAAGRRYRAAHNFDRAGAAVVAVADSCAILPAGRRNVSADDSNRPEGGSATAADAGAILAADRRERPVAADVGRCPRRHFKRGVVAAAVQYAVALEENGNGKTGRNRDGGGVRGGKDEVAGRERHVRRKRNMDSTVGVGSGKDKTVSHNHKIGCAVVVSPSVADPLRYIDAVREYAGRILRIKAHGLGIAPCDDNSIIEAVRPEEVSAVGHVEPEVPVRIGLVQERLVFNAYLQCDCRVWFQSRHFDAP